MKRPRYGPPLDLFALGENPQDRSLPWRDTWAEIQNVLEALVRRAASRAVTAAGEEISEERRLAH
jgi:hypothetical protein